jgi:hypothetical protein
VTVPADDCTAEAGGCNPTGGLEIVLPEGFEIPPGATITQTPVPIADPRVVNGRCDGVTPLSLFDGQLIIPGYLCGGADGFTALVTETSGIDIREGVVTSTAFPEIFSPDALLCEQPIVTDRELQDVLIWQTTDRADLAEGQAIEITHECGSSRGRTRGFSFFVVGMFIDFGLGPNAAPDTITQAFVNLAGEKAEALLAATEAADVALKNGDATKLRSTARDIIDKLDKGRYSLALQRTETFLKFVDAAEFDTTIPFNHEGNLIMRGGNIRFILDVKIIPFVEP